MPTLITTGDDVRPVTGSLDKLIREYKARNPDEEIVYTGPSGTYPSDCYEFTDISRYAQNRGGLHDTDVRNVLEWWGHGNSVNYFQEQYGNGVRKSCPVGEPQQITRQVSPPSGSGKNAIEQLTTLPGFKVHTASAILSVMDPDSFAVLGEQQLRALPSLAPGLAPANEHDRSEWLAAMRNFETNPDVYEFYQSHVRDIAQQSGKSCREVDMALWAYAETTLPRPF